MDTLFYAPERVKLYFFFSPSFAISRFPSAPLAHSLVSLTRFFVLLSLSGVFVFFVPPGAVGTQIHSPSLSFQGASF